MDISNPVIFDSLKAASGQEMKCKIVSTGIWDMDATRTINVAHGLTFTKIVDVRVFVYDDTLNNRYDFCLYTNYANAVDDRRITVDVTNVLIARETAGLYDNPAFNSVAFSRGDIFIWYYV